MDSVDRTSRRRTADLTYKPETGLAEWTSKIKALQRQVDQDEEDETRRLEQEIAASRLARLRRSTGGASRNTSLDLSKSDIAASLKDLESDSPVPEAKSPGDVLRNQDDALRKLSGDTQKVGTTYTQPPIEKRDAPKAPISLAAFIGGRATGPRLTKHAPQQDAHDPTQFEQRTITAPHPVFGRGGVAMPGLTKPGNGAVPSAGTNGFATKASPFPERDRRTSTPPVVKAFVQRVEENRTITAQPTGGSSYSSRQRTISTPTGVHPQRSPRTETFDSTILRASPVQASPSGHILSPDSTLRSTTPQGRRTPAQPEPSRSVSRSPLPRASPAPVHTPPPPAVQAGPKSPISSPSLSRPIQPQVRMNTGAVQSSPSNVASPAFLKPPPSKDPTPSISRLQGRGFVQSMVRASSQLEAASSVPSSPSQNSNRSEPVRKPTVLDRWQHDSGKSSPPIISPKPISMRKSHTADVSFPVASNSQAASPPKIIKPEYTGRSLKSTASTPSMSHAYMSSRAQSDVGTETPSRLQGLGSGNTMISYIKPVKTGDQPITASTPSRPASRQSRPPSRPPSAAAQSRKGSPEPEVDELGMRRPRTRSIGADRRGGPVREALVESHATGGSGQALSHPTKGRARKPRKARDSTKAAAQQNALPQSGLGVSGGRPRSIEQAVSTPAKPPPPFQATGIHRPGTTGVAELEDRKKIVVPASTSTSVIPEPKESARGYQTASSVVEDVPQIASKVAPISLPTTRPTSVPSERSPITPVRHGRIPSTGNRATVMDVALALSEHEAQSRKSIGETNPEHSILQTPPSPKVESPTAQDDEMEDTDTQSKPDVKAMVANWGPRNGASSSGEKRKSSYDKYSAFVLPPLTEEKTPINSPAGTLRGRATIPPSQESTELSLAPVADKVLTEQQEASSRAEILLEAPAELPIEPKVVVIEHVDKALPRIDVKHLLNPSEPGYTPDPDVNPISVEVMSVLGNSASVVEHESNVFYDAEVLVVIYRYKTKSSGLVGTKVWSWIGAKATAGDREERKIQELARRYNTSRIAVSQYFEPAELVYHLGGTLAIRQGTRAHWSSENTAMHIVRKVHGTIFVDEIDLTVKNLCSGFAYCLSLLGTVYVWYGKGAIPEEKLAAVEYARRLAVAPESIVELSEGENDDDEMFWMILGERDYAQADYWQWRRASPARSPRLWEISETRPFAHDVSSDLAWASLHDHVYVVDNIWEYFVLIGSNARSKRTETRLALEIAATLSRQTSSAKPFCPSIHALVFPSQIPTDLRLSLRGMDELSLNHGEIPDHMNLTSADRALELLRRTTWEKTMLDDPLFLPIGLTPDNIHCN